MAAHRLQLRHGFGRSSVQSGDVRGFAVTSKTRARPSRRPDDRGNGQAGFRRHRWFGLLGRRDAAAVVTRLNEDLNRVVLAPEFRAGW